jgi:hypothetical protein
MGDRLGPVSSRWAVRSPRERLSGHWGAHADLAVFQMEADINDLHPDCGRLAASTPRT